MKKAFDCISAALFFSVLILFAVYTVMNSKSDLPEIDKDLTKNLEKYTEKNFPLAENWRSLYTTIITNAGQNRISDVYVSENGMIELFSEYDEGKIDKVTEEYNLLASKHKNVAFYSLIIPTACGIYYSDLPIVMTVVDQQKLIDDIYFKLDNTIQTLDAYNPLFSARDDYIYFRTDSSWTEYGAYTVYNKVIKKMGFSPLKLASYDMEYADRKFYGDLYEKTYYNGTNPDMINIMKNKNGSFVTGFSAWSEGQEFTSTSIYYTPALNNKNKLDIFLGGNSFDKYRIRTTNTKAPKLLIIKGDYANLFVPFLTPHYSEITMIDPDLLGDKSIEEAVDIDSFDQVLMLYDIVELSK